MLKKGFTLIEALVLLFVFSIITSAFYTVFSKGTVQIIESKNRLSATAVANEKMEIIRNLDYDSVGTKKLNGDGSYSYGIPAGDILEDETIQVNNLTLSVHSFVQYVDDAFDGKASGTTPLDVIPNDYKRAKITVSWGAGGAAQEVILVSTFVPQGVELASGGGTLSINVIDNAGIGISGATVHITNTSLTPHIDITTNTDSTGNLMLPGAKASSQAYQLEVSKSGYYTVTTYAPYPTTSYNPIDIHASVVAAAFNQKTIVMDKASDIAISTKDVFGVDLPSIAFHLEGGRKLGDTNAAPIEAVYSVDQDSDSDTAAKVEADNQSAGIYTVTLTNASRYQLLRLSDPDAIQNTFSVVDGVAKNIDMFIIDKEISAALVIVKDSADAPIQNASVHLTNIIAGYDATLLTDQYGQAYFPETAPALITGSYDYTVTLSGYATESGVIGVGSDMKTEQVVLNAS